jgi:ribosomal protein S18 acetylase RimI-like enzyme
VEITHTPLLLVEQMIIRPANQNDLPALEWNGEYRRFRSLYKDIYQSTLRQDAIMWLAELPQAGVIGQLFIQLISARKELADGVNRAYIYAFRIQPKYRSKGLGSELLIFVEKDLVQRGFRWVTLNVGKDNFQAKRLYEKYAYQVVAEEPGRWSYTDDRGNRQEVIEPAWRMEKDLLK